MLSDRHLRLHQLLLEAELDLLALLPGPSLYYLTGVSFHLMERPIVGLFPQPGPAAIVLPEMEQGKAEASAVELRAYAYGEDLASRERAFHRAVEDLGLDGKTVGAETLGMRLQELRLLEAAAPSLRIVSGDQVTHALRIVKDKAETEAMRQAVVIAEQAILAALPMIKVGMSELELASEITLQLLRAGSEPKLPFAPIVASGPNSALPHASAGERTIQPGQVLLIDWGASFGGYVSDLTRVFAVGEVDEEFVRIHQVVLQANAAGRSAVRPGAACQDIDRAARQVIEEAGYGEHFIHRTGHGLGLEAHEPPYIRSDNPQRLAEGMAFTVEPGVYLHGRGGVRLEDDVLVTSSGSETLSQYGRHLQVIA